jgi:hypothetical protein
MTNWALEFGAVDASFSTTCNIVSGPDVPIPTLPVVPPVPE